MQTITLIALGKLNADYYAKAAAEYAKRLSAYCRLNIVELPEEPIAEKNASPAVIGKALEKEARAILTAVPKGSSLAALCVEGTKNQRGVGRVSGRARGQRRGGRGVRDRLVPRACGQRKADGVSAAFHEQNDIPAPACAGDAAGAALPRVFHQPRRKIPQVTQKRPAHGRTDTGPMCGALFAAASPGVNPDGAPGRRALHRALSFCRCRTAGRQRPAGRGCIFQRFS